MFICRAGPSSRARSVERPFRHPHGDKKMVARLAEKDPDREQDDDGYGPADEKEREARHSTWAREGKSLLSGVSVASQ